MFSVPVLAGGVPQSWLGAQTRVAVPDGGTPVLACALPPGQDPAGTAVPLG